MPLDLDFLTQIINVHWGGGGVFIAANNDSNIYCLELGVGDKPDEKPAWQSLGTLDFFKEEGDRWTGSAQGSAFGAVADAKGDKKPVFVLVGGGGSTHAIGIIMASKDGKKWSRVFSYGADSDTYQGSVIFGVVWDEPAQKFYAGGHQSDSFSDPAAEYESKTETDLLFASSDGFAWSEVGRHETKIESVHSDPFPPWPEYPTGLLAAHCSTMVVDSYGNGVPGGNYGYDEDAKVLIAPKKPAYINYLFGNTGVFADPNVVMTFSGEGDPPSIPLRPGLPVTCVAFAGGEWVVAGGVDDPMGGGQPPAGGGKSQAAILVSSDAGYVWESLNPPGTNTILTLTGGVIDAGL